MKTLAFIAAAALAGSMAVTVGVVAQEIKPEEAVEVRQGLMRAQAWQLGYLSAVVKGEREYDQQEVVDRARYLAALSEIVPQAFQVPSANVADTRAKPVVWEDMQQFQKELDEFQTAADQLVEVARQGGRDELRLQFAEVAGACRSCHETFRAEE